MFSKGQCLLFEREFHHVIRSRPNTSYITLTGPRKARAIHTRDYNHEMCRGPKIQGDFLLNNEKGPKMAQRYFACSE